MNQILLLAPVFSDELLEHWSQGKWCDGYPITDIAALSSLLLYEKRLRLTLEARLDALSNPFLSFPC